MRKQKSKTGRNNHKNIQ